MRPSSAGRVLPLLLPLACSPAAPPAASGATARATSTAHDPVATRPPVGAPPAERTPPAEPRSDPPAPPAIARPLGPAEAISVLFPQGLPANAPTACPETAGGDERTRCLVRVRFDGSPDEAAVALHMLDSGGHLAGVEREWVMDGGFRGTIRLVPELPVGAESRHLRWVAAAMDDFESFFVRLGPRASRPMEYRWRALAFRFFRSVGRTTPSAYASDWTVAYNVAGSLHRSGDKVRETLFHELFHLNDQAHGEWTRSHLSSAFDEIVARCGTNRSCLAPWAPSQTTVRGGTYYAFQPDNGEGFHEYGAELALRYYREQRTILNGGRVARPFKCGPDPNGRVWSLLAEEFFGGADVVPAC